MTLTWKQCIAAMTAALVLSALPLSAASPKKTSSKSSKSKSRSKGKSTAKKSPPRQQTPSPERYREIQQALADKGYYSGEVNGVWNADSVEALKKFQAERNLVVDGKLGALSIIALGLGPNRETTSQIEAKPQAQP